MFVFIFLIYSIRGGITRNSIKYG